MFEWLLLAYGVLGSVVPMSWTSALGWSFLGAGLAVLGFWVARCRRRVEPEGRDASLTDLVGGEGQ